MMCICTKAFVHETGLFSPNERKIIFSKEDLERDSVRQDWKEHIGSEGY